MTGHPFSKLSKTELPIHGWIFNAAGSTPVHRLKNGKYVRRYKTGWTNSAQTIEPDHVYPTREEAEAARKARKLKEPEPVQLEMFAQAPPAPLPPQQSERAQQIAERIASEQREKRALERAVRPRRQGRKP
jgi:hypothetical protein